jgi:hypothetical protein
MSEAMRCDALAELAPELALGIVTGEQRARALGHLARCPDCRRRVQELSALADALVLLPPAQEPPVGFESRVLAALPTRIRPRRWRRLALVAAALLLAASVGGSGVFAAGRGDRDLAERYRHTLAVAGGEAFGAWQLGDAGTVLVYQGSPSWMFVSMRPPAGTGPFACDLVLTSGRRVALGTFGLQRYQTGWGRTIPVKLDEVDRVELRDLGRNRTFQATLRQA